MNIKELPHVYSTIYNTKLLFMLFTECVIQKVRVIQKDYK